MLIRYIFFLSVFLNLLSCSSGSLSNSKTTLISEVDTFFTSEGLMCVSDTDKAYFETFYTNKFDTSESKCITIFKESVSRNGDTLLLAIDGKKTAYINDSKIESDSYTEYHFIKKFETINYYLLKVYYYEGFSYLMVNTLTGKETYLCGEPAISRDNTKIASSCFDLQAGFVFNGIQLFSVTPDSLTMVWSRELSKWGADKIAWTDNGSLVAEQITLDSTLNTKTTYIKIVSCK